MVFFLQTECLPAI